MLNILIFYNMQHISWSQVLSITRTPLLLVIPCSSVPPIVHHPDLVLNTKWESKLKCESEPEWESQFKWESQSEKPNLSEKPNPSANTNTSDNPNLSENSNTGENLIQQGLITYGYHEWEFNLELHIYWNPQNPQRPTEGMFPY